MPEWINNTHAGYVLAAYAAAAAALIGLAAVSIRAYKNRVKEWRALSQSGGDNK